MDYSLPDISLLEIKTIEKVNNQGTFVIEPLSPGYGVTIGNSLRRVLLSSLEGAAITAVKIEDVTHQFTTIPNVKEDVVEIILNLKSLRFRHQSSEPVILKLHAKGPKKVLAADFAPNPLSDIVNKDSYLATLDKAGKLNLEITVARGRGYVPVERRRDEKLPLGTLAVDSIFTPVKKVHFEIENTRVGQMTNYDKLSLEITTDGSIDPEEALGKASQILQEHFSLVHQACTAPVREEKVKKVKTITKKDTTKKKPATKSKK